jgi:S1-C subfamily serine protease
VTLDAPLYRYIDATAGAFARTDLAGNLGCLVWERFRLTFDYARSRVFLRAGRTAHDPFVFNRAGLIVNPTAQGLVVIAVVPASPAAAAGAVSGDRVVSVAGRSVEGHGGLDALTAAFLQPVGTVLLVRVLRAGTPLDITLTLADLV